MNPVVQPSSSAFTDLKIREKAAPIDDKVAEYLAATKDRYRIGQHEYYARQCLEQALTAHKEGNYGIGSVAVLVQAGIVYEFPARNAMISGLGVHDHAEARALDDCQRFKATVLDKKALAPLELLRTTLVQPLRQYSKNLNENTAALADGMHVFGTLEPCPMCTCMEINAKVKSSISTVQDGELKTGDKGPEIHGAASAIGDKFLLVPKVWQYIANGQGLKFELLKSEDQDLKALSEAIFTETRQAIDDQLASRAIAAIVSNKSKTESSVFDLGVLHDSYLAVREAFPNAAPKSSLVLGTGWLPDDKLNVLGTLSYEKIAGLGQTGVSGHAGQLMWVKDSSEVEHFIWKGRRHVYELIGSERTPLATIPYITSQFKSESLILTQGVGGVSCEPKTFLVVKDHIGPSDLNAFPGPHASLFRDEFAALTDLYDEKLRKVLCDALTAADAKFKEGVYYFWPAKQFQTPAEIRMIKAGEGDVVGKSLILEAMYASQLGLKVGGLCLVTNWAAGLAEQGPSHQFHLDVGKEMGPVTAKILAELLPKVATLGK